MLCDRHKFALREMLFAQLAQDMKEIIESERLYGEETTKLSKVEWNEKYKSVHVLMGMWRMTIPSRFAPYDFPPEADEVKTKRVQQQRDRFVRRSA